MSVLNLINVGEQDVPGFLRCSPFFQEVFQESEQDSISIPADCFKESQLILSDEQLHILCKTVRFWLIPEYLECSDDLFSYILHRDKGCGYDLFDSGLYEQLPILQKLARATAEDNPHAILREAVRQDLAGFVEHMHNSGYVTILPETTSIAAEFGCLNTLRSLHQMGFQITRSLARLSALGGHLACLKYLHLNGCPVDIYTCQAAAMGDKLPCLKYLIEQCGVPVAVCRSVLSRAASASLDCLKYLFEKGCPCDVSAAVCAAEAGNLACLQYLRENSPTFAPTVTVAAAFKGQLECLVYVVEQGGMLSLRAMGHAALGGHLDCIQYLREVGCGWSVNTCRAAAQRGHLHCLHYLHSNGCPWNERTTTVAARNGHDDCLRYALDCGCPFSSEVAAYVGGLGDIEWLQQLHAADQTAHWNEQICFAAIRSGAFECLRSAVKAHGCPGTVQACAVAAQCNQLDALQYLHETGCMWDASTCEAAQKSDAVECLAYALEHGCPWDYTVNMQAKRCAAYLRLHKYW